MASVNVALNHPATNAITMAVGKLIVNFGSIEYETYIWLACQHDGIDTFPGGELFSARARRVIAGLAPAVGEHVPDAVGAWNRALELAIFRNRIAHSPILFGWSSDDQSSPPDLLIVMDIKGAYQTGAAGAKVTISEINTHVNAAAELAQELRTMRGQIWS